jgi:hypothetical protein
MEHLGEQKFKTNDELKSGVMNWLRSQPAFFCVADISALPRRWQKCVSIEGQYLEKE